MDPRHICPALLILAALVFAWIFADYGITWDEGVQSTYGEMVVDCFASGGRDVRCNEYRNLFYYSPLFEGLAAAAYRGAAGFKYEIRHALIGLAALCTLAAVWRFGRLFGPVNVPCIALLALLMMPRFIGHAFNNSKDIPFACGFAWAMVAIGRLLLRRRWSWPDVLLCGAGIGLALSMRVGAVLLFPFLFAGVALSWVLIPDERRKWRTDLVARGIRVMALIALAWGIMTAFWPWTHASPLIRPLAALSEMSSFSHSYPMQFAGEIIESSQAPRHYLPWYLAITTPIAVLLLALVGLAVSLRDQWSRPREPRTILVFLLQLWLLFPVAYFIVAQPNVYDGIRHFLFVLPAMALFCGLGAAWILDRVGARRVWVAGVLTALLGTSMWSLVTLHPYQSSYFNAFVGGLRGAWRDYDVDYWTSSYREAMQWILRESAERPDETLSIVVACNTFNRPCAEHYLERAAREATGAVPVTMDCVWTGREPIAPGTSYYVGMRRYGRAETFFPDWPVVRHIGRRGALFTVIKRNPAVVDPG
jgi:hypothetical protein